MDIHPTLYVVSPRWSRLDSVVWPMENRFGSSLNQIKGWTTVRESYPRALGQAPLLSRRRGSQYAVQTAFLHFLVHVRVLPSDVVVSPEQKKYYNSGLNIQSGAATCTESFAKCFLRVPQAVGLYCSCHAAQASEANF